MTRHQHGLVSLVSMVLAIGVGIMAIAFSAPVLAFAYFFISVFSALVVVYSFCAKCPCRKHSCGHIFPGKLTKFLPKRTQGAYRIPDYLGITGAFLVIFLFPQYWLRGNVFMAGLFWALIIYSSLNVFARVCKDCSNIFCPLCRKRVTHRRGDRG